jgi:hypothetical protein
MKSDIPELVRLYEKHYLANGESVKLRSNLYKNPDKKASTSLVANSYDPYSPTSLPNCSLVIPLPELPEMKIGNKRGRQRGSEKYKGKKFRKHTAVTNPEDGMSKEFLEVMDRIKKLADV